MIKIDFENGKFTLTPKKFAPEINEKLGKIKDVEPAGDKWTVPKNKSAIRAVVNELGHGILDVSDKAYEVMNTLKESKLLDYDGKVFELHVSFSEHNRQILKYKIGDCYKRKSKRCWSVPDNYWSLYQVMKYYKPLEFTKEAQKRIDEYTEKINHINKELVPKLNTIKEAPVDVIPVDFEFKGKFDLYPHQIKMWWAGKEFLKAGAGFAFFAEPGVGKSAPAVNVAAYFIEKGLAEKVLMITPATLKYNMAEQFEIHSDLRANVLMSYKKDRRKGKSGRRWRWTKTDVSIEDYYDDYDEYLENEVDSPIQIVNYKCLSKEWKHFKDYDLYIADEFHYLKHRTSNRSKAMKKLSAYIPYRLALTATPITKNALDLFSQFDILDPDIFPNRYQTYRDIIANTFEMEVPNARSTITKVSSFKNKAIEKWLKPKIASRSIRYTTDETLDLIDPRYERIVIDMPPVVERFYKELVSNQVAEIGKMGDENYKFLEAANKLVVVTYARQISQGFINIRDEEGNDHYHELSDFKVRALIDLLSTFSDEQVIIWYRHKFLLEMVKRELDKEFKKAGGDLEGKSYTVINGDYTDLEQASRASEFRKGEYDYILASIDVTEGWQGQTAKIGIWLENHFTFDKREQAEGRIYREGQNSKPVFYDIIAKKSIDLRIIKSIYKGESLSEQVLADNMEDWAPFLKEE